MKTPRLYCPSCGREIQPDQIEDQSEESGYALSVEVSCLHNDCGKDSTVIQE